jgi:hypothetical protein
MPAFAPIPRDKSIHTHHSPQAFRSFNNLPRSLLLPSLGKGAPCAGLSIKESIFL